MDVALLPFFLRDWSLRKGRGGGQLKFYPYIKGGKEDFSHAEGGCTKSSEVVIPREL